MRAHKVYVFRVSAFPIIMTVVMLLMTGFNVKVMADSTHNLRIEHVDDLGVLITDPEYRTGNVGDQIIVAPIVSPYYQNRSPVAYTYTGDLDQVLRIEYRQNTYNGPPQFRSLYADTLTGHTPFQNSTAEFGGNIVYTEHADERLNLSYAEYGKYIKMQNKVATAILTLPPGNKFTINPNPNTYVYLAKDDLYYEMIEGMDPDYLDLAENGIIPEYFYSTDNGVSYDPIDQVSVNDAVTHLYIRIKFSQDLLNDGGAVLGKDSLSIISSFSLTMNRDALSPSEAQGDAPISGWKYRTSLIRNTVNINTNVRVSSPTLSGIVRTHATGSNDWENATPYAGVGVQLYETINGADTLVAETQTDNLGNYRFDYPFNKINNLRVVVLKDGYDSIFSFKENAELKYELGSRIEIGDLRLLRDVVQPTIDWKDGQQPLHHISNLNFMLQKKPLQQYTLSFDSQGGTSVAQQTVEEGGTFILPSIPTRQGYTFQGWYLSPTADALYDFNQGVSDHAFVYARWSLIKTDTGAVNPTNPAKPVDNPDSIVPKPENTKTLSADSLPPTAVPHNHVGMTVAIVGAILLEINYLKPRKR
ncbi:hypothetical protein G7062_09805 [Erysipelothrix sp. HDW6C]|uniref:InlB B-repeat-containing protein n=1 Tax=Erysipelothrix sp. HDW6C TaxID=2714930 RepID=UPI00140B852D|nr:InlB B-repeat-containing protein [Erysipelothrix sp. HDW6C]QIK70578.1 hypothetical protein G7062_09805 [Erysipelothrix sp. HDW6C]